jgi:hypothetical protein
MRGSMIDSTRSYLLTTIAIALLAGCDDNGTSRGTEPDPLGGDGDVNRPSPDGSGTSDVLEGISRATVVVVDSTADVGFSNSPAPPLRLRLWTTIWTASVKIRRLRSVPTVFL